MPGLEWILSFVGITFPIFLLIPPLLVSLEVRIKPRQEALFWGVLVVQYITLASVVAVEFVEAKHWPTLGLLVFSVILASIPLSLVIRWSLREQIEIWLRPE